MSIETMKQALEALENSHGYLPVKTGVEREVDKAITALRQAIEFEEMVQKGTKAWADTPDDWVDELRGGAEKTVPSQKPGKWVYPDWEPPETYSQTKLELCGVCGWDAVVPGEGCLNCARFKQWLKQSEQEPIGEIVEAFEGLTAVSIPEMPKVGTKLYTTPPKREWVGLTAEEVWGLVAFEGASLADFIRYVEAKLKEKNNG